MSASFPLSEIFQSIQGEGLYMGCPATFIRFQGCDYKCSWCDTKYAQNSDASAIRSMDEILDQTPINPEMVVLTGGNPALYELGELIEKLQNQDHFVAMETQGSQAKKWFKWLDHLTLSPKPPSSGMPYPADLFEKIVRDIRPASTEIKVVINVGLERDWDFAEQMRELAHENKLPFVLQVMTGSGAHPEMILDELRRAVNIAKGKGWDTRLDRILPQLHFLIWRGERLR